MRNLNVNRFGHITRHGMFSTHSIGITKYKTIYTVLFLLFLCTCPFGTFGLVSASGAGTSSAEKGNPQKLVEEGIAQYKEENFEEALVLFNKVKAEHPGTAILSYYVGMTYKQLGDMPRAEAGLKEALNYVPPYTDAYDELISVLYNEEKYAEALEWIGKAEKENVKPDVIAYLKGLVLLKTDDNAGAIEALSKAKELNKEISESVDVQLAVAYTKEHQFKEAQSVLDSIIASQPNSEAANFAREFQKTVEKGKELYKEWQFTAGVSYQFDDNVVLLPNGGISGVNITNKSDSSVIESFRIDYRPYMGGKWFFNTQYNANNQNYFKIDSHNMMTQSITLTPGYNLKPTVSLSLPLSYNYVFLNYKQYLSLFSAKPTVNWLVATNNVLQGYAGYERRNMFGIIYDPNENRTGNRYLGGAGYIYTFMEGKGMFNLKYELSHDDTEGQNWKNTGNTFDVGLVLPIAAGVYTVLNGEANIQDYNDVHTAFGIKRHDESYNENISFVWQALKNMDVSAQYSHTTVDSNIYIYQYNRNMYTAGIEYRF